MLQTCKSGQSNRFTWDSLLHHKVLKLSFTAKGSNSIEEGIMAVLQSMEAGNFKVFSTLSNWFEEFRMYHRKGGKVVPFRDDLMSATRYAFQSQRFAVSGSDPAWTQDITYKNYGIV